MTADKILSEINIKYNPIESSAESKNKSVKPFVKWAGGKGQLLPEIRKNYPIELETEITKYAEIFVGGGAVLFDILNTFSLKEIYISDINLELINTYKTIQRKPEELISELNNLEKAYLPLNSENRKIVYYKNRERYNELILSKTESTELSALFIFLNRTCFNGLYRVNAKGLFNVPMGDYKNPKICDSENIRNISELLQNVKICCCDYRKSLDFIDENTFVYIDPPYRPLNITSNFTSYTDTEFDDKAQTELAEYVNLINKKNSKILLSNSDPKNTNPDDNFFDDLYAKYRIQRIRASRMINSKAEKRGKISELLISNYEG